MKNFSASWLFQFQQLLESQSFKDTALKLKISQQALSKNIQLLEVWAGHELLRRQPGRLDLTPAGILLQEEIPRLLLSLQCIGPERHDASSRLHIGVLPFWSLNYLPRVLPRILHNWPELDLQVTPLPEKEILAFLQAGELDLGLLMKPTAYPFYQQKLPGLAWVLAVAPALLKTAEPLPYLTYVHPDDPPPFCISELLPAARRDVGQVSSLLLLRELMCSGLAAGLILEAYIHRELAEGKLVRLPMAEQASVQPCAVRLDGVEPHPALSDFLMVLQQEMMA